MGVCQAGVQHHPALDQEEHIGACFALVTLAFAGLRVRLARIGGHKVARNFLEEVIALRTDALRELRQSPAFDAFTALDNAAVSLGADRATLDGRAFVANPIGALMVERVRNRLDLQRDVLNGKPPKSLSQGDAAEEVLRLVNTPLRLTDLLVGIEEKGVVVTGDRIANFRSSLSRDTRFYSLKFDNQYLWWLNGVPLAQAWVEATGYDLVVSPAELSFHSSEGGDGDATTTTET
jgi:hypothetical protein